MKCRSLVNAIGLIDGKFVDEAENYKSKRKISAWIWAVSAACLCVVIFIAAKSSLIFDDTLPVGIIVASGEAVNGYVDYRKLAETGKVLITDELQYELERVNSKEYKDYESIIFNVRIIDANGADNKAIASALGWWDETFINSGTLCLADDKISTIKGVPGMALIITTEYIRVNEKYLNTAGRDKFDVKVGIKLDYDWLNSQYKGGSGTEFWEWRDNYVSGLVNEYANDYGIKFDQEVWAGFRAELDTELISRLLQDDRTSAVLVPSF